jgi:hypothetical protein
MNLGLFLQNLTLTDGEVATSILALIVAFFAIFMVFFVALYLYSSFAYMAIGRKARVKRSGLAWIPFLGPLIIIYKASKMHWWPWLLLFLFFIPGVNILANLAFAVVLVIWHWKTFEVIHKPGWWAILTLIPIVNLVIIGIAAWSK